MSVREWIVLRVSADHPSWWVNASAVSPEVAIRQQIPGLEKHGGVEDGEVFWVLAADGGHPYVYRYVKPTEGRMELVP